MPIQTKTAAQAADKWARRAAAATQDYTAGVQSPRRDWATATKAAEGNYKTAVAEAASKGRYGIGVTKAGTQKYIQGAVEKGASRFAQGVTVAQPAFASGIGEVLNTVAALNLPPRGVKGDPRNLERVRLVADALHKKKVSG